MLKRGEIKMIHKMLKEGMSKVAIARKLGINRATVRKYAKLPEGYIPIIKRKPVPTSVDAYLPNIVSMLEESHKLGVHIPTTAIFDEIKKLGYRGGLRWLQDIMERYNLRRRVESEEELIRFETEPGQQLQVDWVEFQKGGLCAFVATMGYSRASYVEYVDNEKLDTLISCHMNAFNYFGGVPKECLYDNMRTVIIKRNVYGYGKHKFNEHFRDFAKHCGFNIRVCQPYRAKTKGKVERFNHYLKYSFHNPLKVRLSMMGYMLTKENANAEVMDWLDFKANARVHQTTLRQPSDLLAEEQPHLLSLPKPYQGIHPNKVTRILPKNSIKTPKKVRIYIPERDMQSYDDFIPAITYLMIPIAQTGGLLWS